MVLRTEEDPNSLTGSSPPHKSQLPQQMSEAKAERSPSEDGPGSPRAHRWRSRSKSKSKSPPAKSRSPSPSKSRRSRSRSPVASNPGNNLYVTGLSTRVTSADLKKYFAKEGKVTECNLVTDPRSKESRGFAFVTMESTKDADRCVKYLNRTVLEGRLITVEKAKRSRGRTPTPGRYQGLKEKHGERGRRHSRSHSPRRHHDRDRDPCERRERRAARSRSPYRRRRAADNSDPYRRRRD